MSTKKVVISFYRKSDDVKRIILGKNVFTYSFLTYSILLILFGHFLNPISLIATSTQKEYNLKLVDDSINLKVIAPSVESPVIQTDDRNINVEPIRELASFTFSPIESDLFSVRETTFEDKESEILLSFLLGKSIENSKLLSGKVNIVLLNNNGDIISESTQEDFKFRSGRYTSAKFVKSDLPMPVRYVVAKISHETGDFSYLLKEL